MDRETYELLKEFQSKFGFECYFELQKIIGKMEGRIGELISSRNNWKTKYMKLKHGK